MLIVIGALKGVPLFIAVVEAVSYETVVMERVVGDWLWSKCHNLACDTRDASTCAS